MMKRSWIRAVAALVVAFVGLFVFRNTIASELVSRGDDFYRARQLSDARDHYARALMIAPTNPGAAERFTFVSSLIKDAGVHREAIGVATRALASSPDDVDLHRARAMVYTSDRRYRESVADWEFVALHATDRERRVVAVAYVVVAAQRIGDEQLADRYRYALQKLAPLMARAIARSVSAAEPRAEAIAPVAR